MHKQLSSVKKYNIIGLMSGTSLDGLDLVHAEFLLHQDKKWSYEIIYANTFVYDNEWRKKLESASSLSPEQFMQLDISISQHYAKMINGYLKSQKNKLKIDGIASHGQTIFHQPKSGLTTQLGCGQTLASLTKHTVISDFRTKDVTLGGQGAPLVPIGEQYLFSSKIDAFINLGGFANITIKGSQIIAYDICPANILLNQITKEINLIYDKNGDLGRKSPINTTQLDRLNKLNYYSLPTPKSLGTEWLISELNPIINKLENTEEKLGTAYAHIAYQIAVVLNKSNIKNVLITGGGARNSFLIDSIQKQTKAKITLPSEEIIDFKEALIFGFLGVKKLREEVNCLASVTGASKDSVGGVIHNP